MIHILGAVALGAAKTMVLSMLSKKIVLKLTLEILEWAMKQDHQSCPETRLPILPRNKITNSTKYEIKARHR